ncbi:hypothetical protein ONZ45_g11403 [Pleurotus djamor]|nr:hypothetical protein ONZ45_g11403 [Pleurotus djamor]
MSDDQAINVWLESSRLDGMLLGAISWATAALFKKPSHPGETIATHRNILLAYIALTFVLGTIGFAANSRYTQMIWIDLRSSGRDPEELIVKEFDYWINRLAVGCYYVMTWIMDALLLHRCFIVWNYRNYIVTFMSALFLADVAMSIAILVSSNQGAVFADLVFQLAFLGVSISINLISTILVAGRLIAMRKQILAVLGPEHGTHYTSAAYMLIESTALFSVAALVYTIAFGLHNNLQNITLFSISHVQAIAQLLIIIRVAEGRALTADVVSGISSGGGGMVFRNYTAGTVSTATMGGGTASRVHAHSVVLIGDRQSSNHGSGQTQSMVEDGEKSKEEKLEVIVTAV